jgi:hypothetical protein
VVARWDLGHRGAFAARAIGDFRYAGFFKRAAPPAARDTWCSARCARRAARDRGGFVVTRRWAS